LLIPGFIRNIVYFLQSRLTLEFWLWALNTRLRVTRKEHEAFGFHLHHEGWGLPAHKIKKRGEYGRFGHMLPLSAAC
jgi:hypothetical protein